MRSPTCRRHLRPPSLLALPARLQPLPACRCNPILSSSQRKVRSPCSRLHLKLKHQQQHRCSARRWLPLCKASLQRLQHSSRSLLPLPLQRLCQPLALLHLPGDRRSLTFLLPLLLQHLCQLLALLHLPRLPRSLPSLRPQRLQRLCQPSGPPSLQQLQHSSPFLLPQRLQHPFQPLPPSSLPVLQRRFPFPLQRRFQPLAHRSQPTLLHPLPFLLRQRLPTLHCLLPHRRSFPLHSRRLQLHRHVYNHSPERSNPSALSSQPLAASQQPNRAHLLPGSPNLSIPLPRPPLDPWRPKHPQSQALAAPNCSVRFPHRSSQPQLSHRPKLSRQHPRPNQPPACLPHRSHLPFSPLLPSLQPWKKFRLSPLLPLLRRSLPRVDCSAPSL